MRLQKPCKPTSWRRGTLALSWGPYGGFYLHPHRICLGWVALTYVVVELDDLMEAYASAYSPPEP